MARQLVIKLLLMATLFMAVRARGRPGPAGNIFMRSVYDQFTLGQEVDGAKVLYSYQHTQTYADLQSEISLDFDYPVSTSMENSAIVTQVKLYVEASDGATTQAYVTQGGIGESKISLKVVADNSTMLTYMLVIYGKQV